MSVVQRINILTKPLHIKIAFYYAFVFMLVYLLSYSYGREQVYKTYGFVYTFISFITILIIYLSYNQFKLRFYHNGVLFFLLFFLIIILNSTLNGKLKSGLVVGGIQFFIFLSLLFLIQVLKFNKYYYFRTTSNFILLLGFFSFVFGLYVYLSGNLSLGPFSIKYSVYEGGEHRMAAWFGSPNTLASVFSIQILLLIYHLKENRKVIKLIILFILLFASIVGLILTGSRGSILALILGLLNYLIIASKPIKRKRFHISSTLKRKKLFGFLFMGLFILAFLILMVSLGFNKNYLIDRLIRPNNIEAQLDMETFDRTVIFAISIYIISNASLKNLLLGHGSQYFYELTGHSSHSSHFSTIINYGIIAYLILIIFLTYTYFYTIKNNRLCNMHSITSSILIYLAIKGLFNHAFPGYGVEGVIGMMVILVVYLKE